MTRKNPQSTAPRSAKAPMYKCFPYSDDPTICARYKRGPNGKYQKDRERVPCSECQDRFTDKELIGLLTLKEQNFKDKMTPTMEEHVESSGEEFVHVLKGTELEPPHLLSTLKELLDRVLTPNGENISEGEKKFLYPNGVTSIEVTIGFAPAPSLQVKVSGP